MISHHREQTSLLKTVGIVCKVRVNPLSLPLLFLFMLVSLFVQVIHATICQSLFVLRVLRVSQKIHNMHGPPFVIITLHCMASVYVHHA